MSYVLNVIGQVDRKKLKGEYMNYYNKQFQEILKEAQNHGYEFKNGIFEKDPNAFFPVMEVFLQSHTSYEDEGRYYIYKNTFQISKDDYDRIMDYVDLMNGKLIDFDEDFPVELYNDILLKYFEEDKKCNIFEDDVYDGDIEIEKRIYNKYSDKDECGELYFKHKENNDNSFPTGYISFFNMMNKDFEKKEYVNMWLNKFMRYN